MRLARIVVDVPPSLDGDGQARERLRGVLKQKLAQDSSVVDAPDSPQVTHWLQLQMSEALRLEDGSSVRLVEVRLQPTGEASAFAASARVPEQADAVQVATAGFAVAWGTLGRLRQLDVASDAALVQALASNDAALRAYAIERTGERRLRAAVDPLCALLRHEENANLVLKSVGALVAIGDRRAVPALIDLSHQKDPSVVLQVVFAVGALGGRAAEAYLVTLAGGHPDDEVRRGAKDALTEMARRREARAAR